MPVVGLTTVVIEALLVFQISVWTYAVSDIAQARVADATVVQEEKQEQWNGNDVCGWIGVGVSPMTTAFAESLGTSEPYGAIFDQPEPGSRGRSAWYWAQPLAGRAAKSARFEVSWSRRGV